MPATYRVELAKTGRSGCKNSECKKTGTEKIEKGELRFGSLVEIKEHQSWSWKHWGCVTPVQIAGWTDISGGDEDMLDGFDEIDDASKDKIRRALKQGHVDDEDWKGDIEKNRPGQKGFRLTVKEKTEKEKAERAAAGGDSDVDEEAPKSKKRARAPKKASAAAPDDDEDDEEMTAPPPKKARGRPAKKAKEEDDADDADELPAAPAKPNTKAKRNADTSKKSKAKVVKAEEPSDTDEGEMADEDPVPEPAKKKAGRPKKEKAADTDAPAEPEKKKAGRPKKTVDSDAAPPQKKAAGRPKKTKATA